MLQLYKDFISNALSCLEFYAYRMMSSSATSPSVEKQWFQDTRTGSDKQTHYFVRIRKLQDELIHREQHNLINAMERLKQITYPRKRPVIRNFTTNPSTNHSSSQSFPTRRLNLKRDKRNGALPPKEQAELKPISGKPLMTKSESKHDKRERSPPFFVMPPLLNDKEIAKIIQKASNTLPLQPSGYLLQPHLPSIPNVARKNAFSVDNRLRLLTLADSEFNDFGESRFSRTVKLVHTGQSQRRVGGPETKSNPNTCSNDFSGNKRKRDGKKCLTFDVDPNDPVLFSHCVEDKIEGDNWEESTPLPPPNSRPSSTRSKSSQGVHDLVTQSAYNTEIIVKLESMRKQSNAVNKSTFDTAGKGHIPVVNIKLEGKEADKKPHVLEFRTNLDNSAPGLDRGDSSVDGSKQ